VIAHLRGTIGKSSPGDVSVDIAGVGYAVTVPMTVWDALQDGAEATLFVVPYIREDRFDLYGFQEVKMRTLFRKLIDLSGIGPKLGLELCAVPMNLILQSIHDDDPGILATVKGVGKKTAEKLLLELKSLLERSPELFETRDAAPIVGLDRDAVEALTKLGFTQIQAMQAIKNLPHELTSTEQRVAAALRFL
jgi:Holliday junction DNA helicase RuvA